MRRHAVLAAAFAALSSALLAPARAAVPDDCRSSVDDPPPANGPASHRVVQAVSTDGVHFTDAGAPALLKASVPEGLERPNGEFWVYYISGEAGRHGIHIGRVAAGGEIVPFECVRLDGAFDGHAVDPDVVRLADGRLRLFYKGDFGQSVPGAPAIESAISHDGIHFTREGVALDAPGGADPTVVQAPDGSWLMATPAGESIHLARGTDGVHFSPLSTLPIGGIPELWVTGSTVHLLAGANRFGHLVSNDSGQTWGEGTIEVAIADAHALGSPSIAGHAGAWRMFVIELDPPGGGGGGGGGSCQPGETTLCLHQGRFRATASWKTPDGAQGPGHARNLGGDSGFFWFFGPDNAELLVKVLDGCALNDAFWAFAAGLTNLEVELRVEDLVGGGSWVRRGTPGIPFPSAIDAQAFPTCAAGGGA